MSIKKISSIAHNRFYFGGIEARTEAGGFGGVEEHRGVGAAAYFDSFYAFAGEDWSETCDERSESHEDRC